MATCFGLSLDHPQASVIKSYSQCVLCTVGSHITYTVYAKVIKNIKVYVKVKMLLVRMYILNYS
jgi:hypothetical protein